MMNIGIYLETLQLTPEVDQLVASINKPQDGIDDISIFYDNIGACNVSLKCGAFNATDLWYFSGLLILTKLSQLPFISKLVNNIRTVYVSDNTRGDVLSLMGIASAMPVIARSKEDYEYIHRVTGIEPVGITEELDLSQILEVIDV